MAQTILYYPKINIEDGAWLRNAVLYWDEVSSIVPYDNYADLSVELLYLQSCGVYHAVYPRDLFCSDYVNDFCNTIVKRISDYDKSMVKALETKGTKVKIHKNKIYAPALHELIHYSKLPPNLLKYFRDKRFVNDYNTDGLMEMDSRIAQIYMRTLAEYSIKCSNKDIVLGTDSVSSNREIYHNVSFSRNGNTQTQCCKINLINCLPQPSLDVGFEEILDFKSRRKDELIAFKAKIRELETNIYRAESPEEIKHYEAQFKESWECCSDDYKRVLKEAGITFLLTSLVSLVEIPSVQQAMSQFIGPDLITLAQSAVPLIQIGVGCYEYKNKISPVKSDGGFSYIIKANKDGIIQL